MNCNSRFSFQCIFSIQCWPDADCDHVNTSQHLQEADKPADEGGGGSLVQALVGGGQ